MGTHCMIFAAFMQFSSYFKINIKSALGDFPGGPVVSTPCFFHCWGPRVPSLVKELRSHKPWGSAKKKKKVAKKIDPKNPHHTHKKILITRKNIFLVW